MTNKDSGARRRDVWLAVLCGIAVGVVIYVLLVPASGIDRQPPECYAPLGHVVPCGDGLSIGLAAAGTVAAAVLTYAARRRGR